MTPGPWMARRIGGGRWRIDGPDRARTGRHVAVVPDEADAEVIARLPAILRALAAAYDGWDRLMPVEELARIREMMRKALGLSASVVVLAGDRP